MISLVFGLILLVLAILALVGGVLALKLIVGLGFILLAVWVLLGARDLLNR